MKSLPGEIENESMAIIQKELRRRGQFPEADYAAVVLRCIHASADFDYAETLRFSPGAVQAGAKALQHGAELITDTNMALAGISRPGLEKLHTQAHCFIAQRAKDAHTTRAATSMVYAAEHYPKAIFAIGNAPTALLKLSELIAEGLRPALVIAVPVGFVNVTESKEQLVSVCADQEVAYIAAMGRKGGSSIAAAVCNALIYSAAEMLEPKERGWS